MTCVISSATIVTIISAETRMKTCRSSVRPATCRVTTTMRPVISAWMPKLARLTTPPTSN